MGEVRRRVWEVAGVEVRRRGWEVVGGEVRRRGVGGWLGLRWISKIRGWRVARIRRRGGGGLAGAL